MRMERNSGDTAELKNGKTWLLDYKGLMYQTDGCQVGGELGGWVKEVK